MTASDCLFYGQIIANKLYEYERWHSDDDD